MNADPASVGTPCSVPSCNSLDFLPIRCLCDRNFCTVHAPADAHQCTFVSHSTPDPDSSTKRERCAAPSCNKPSIGSSSPHSSKLSSAACSSCRLSFCVDHRHPDTHSCSALARPEKLAQEKDAHIHVKQQASAPDARLPPSVVRPPSKLPSDPKKAAMVKKVALMKMRHRAVPADPKDSASSVSLDQRLHVTLKHEPTEPPTQGNKSDKIVWFRKSVITGRAVDLARGCFGLSTSDRAMQLQSMDDPDAPQILLNDRPLGEQIEDASTLWLRFMPSS